MFKDNIELRGFVEQDMKTFIAQDFDYFKKLKLFYDKNRLKFRREYLERFVDIRRLILLHQNHILENICYFQLFLSLNIHLEEILFQIVRDAKKKDLEIIFLYDSLETGIMTSSPADVIELSPFFLSHDLGTLLTNFERYIANCSHYLKTLPLPDLSFAGCETRQYPENDMNKIKPKKTT